jgi:hypothetical protein
MKKAITVFIIVVLFSSISVRSNEIVNEQQSNLPAYFNYRDIDGVDYTTPMKDQSPAPTCETYALCACLETIIQYQTGELFEPDLSECHLYFYAGGTYEAGGVNVRDAAQYLIDYGVPDEGCYPDPHRAFDYPYESVEGWEDRTVKITEFGWIPHDEQAIKQALVDYGPLTICIHVWEDFKQYKSGVYEHTWGERVGGHLVALVGYDDNLRCWICKNSWGANWGDGGWFKVSYDTDIFIDGCYGGDSGIMYLDGVYGNFKPDVPKIDIIKPTIYRSYFFGIEFPIILRKLPIQAAAPRLIGGMWIKLKVENANKVEFLVDGEIVYIDDSPPFNWKIKTTPGHHVIETIAYNHNSISRDSRDIFKFI